MFRRVSVCLMTVFLTVMSVVPVKAAFTFGSVSDSHDQVSQFTSTVNQLKTLNPNFIIHNGDYEDDGVATGQMNDMTTVLKNAGLFNNAFIVRGNHDDHMSGSAALWENYFSTSPNVKTIPSGVNNYTAMDANSTYLTYSFDYDNSRFIGVDVPGDADLITSAEYTFLDNRLANAKSLGLTHVFIYFHGPEYCVEDTHCSCTARVDSKCEYASFTALVNKYQGLVSATFHGHEHVLGHVHMDNTRVPSLNYPYEEFFTSSAGLPYAITMYPNRIDDNFYSSSLASFATINVNGASFTVNLYHTGNTNPVWSKTFTKSGGVVPTAIPTTPVATPIPTKTPTAGPTNNPTAGPTNVPTTVPVPTVSQPAGQVMAFPGAEGFGANSIGGRGGKVYEVTNTSDAGTGSLRACVEASGPRICVFKVGGLISLNSPLIITNPYITIAGQSAPGGGITLKLGSLASDIDMFLTETHDVIIRYLSQRPGPGGENHGNQIAKNNTALSNIMIDHNSISWGVDSDIETWYRVTNSTIQRSIVSEALNCSTHSKNEANCTADITRGHSKGLMIGGYQGGEGSNSPGSENVSVLNNLMASNVDRNPLIQDCGITQVMNNVTYNALIFSQQQLNCVSGTSYVNWINNYHKKGPVGAQTDLEIIPSDGGSCSAGKVYMNGNVGNNGTWTYNNSCSAASIVTTPAGAPAVATTTANAAYTSVLADVGNNRGLNCDGTWYQRQDAIDARVINDVVNGTGKIIDDPSQVGGWVTPGTGSGCADADHDGMPDVWEQTHGLNPNNAADGSQLAGSGYTNLEEYLNGTGQTGGNPVPSPTTVPTNKPGVSLTPTSTVLVGDANYDGVVNEIDYTNYWLPNYNKTMSGGASVGDFNNDGKVDGIDYVLWLENTQP